MATNDSDRLDRKPEEEKILLLPLRPRPFSKNRATTAAFDSRHHTLSLPLFSARLQLSACWSDIIFLPGARADNSEQRSERKSITLSDKKLLLPAIRISLPTFIPCLLFTPLPPCSTPVSRRSIRFERRKTSTDLPNSVESFSLSPVSFLSCAVITGRINGRISTTGRIVRIERRERALVSLKRKGGVARKRKVGAKSVLASKWAVVTRDTGV